MEEQKEKENDSEVVFKIPPEEWKELMEDWKQLIEMNIETFRQRWMDHPKKGAFLNWKDASIANGATMLICAIWARRFDLFKLLLEHGADITIADNDGDTPLLNAAKHGHADIVKLLLEKGADITIANKKGWSALMSASRHGRSDIVKLLLEKDADITIASKNGWTALMLAAAEGHADIVKLLLEKGADSNVAKEDGWTALMWAAWEGHADIVKLLLEKDADITVADNDGDTPLLNATKQGHANIVKLLLEKDADVNIVGEYGLTALMLASRHGHADIAKLLLEKGADITIASKNGWTALTLASYCGQADIVKLLLEKDADVNIANEEGWTALMYATRDGHADIVKLLLEKDADITKANTNGNTALSVAIEKGHNDIVKLLSEKDPNFVIMEEQKAEWKKLIEKGYYNKEMEIELATFKKQFKPLMEHPNKAEGIHCKDDEVANGMTMLHCAAYCERVDIVKLLLEHGADMNIVDKDGETALMWASSKGRTDSVKLLLEKGADITIAKEEGETALTIAFGGGVGYDDVVKLLLEKVAEDPNILCNSDRQTFLHLSCLHNHKWDAQQVLEVGTDKDLLDGKEHTALFYAAEKGFADVVDVLMKHNVDVNKTDERRLIEKKISRRRAYSFYSVKDGRTPLFVAAQNGHQYAVATLLHHGADPYLCNHEGKLPRHVSEVHGAIQQLFRIHDFFEKREKGDAYESRYKTCRDNYSESTEWKGYIPPLEDIIHDIVKYPHNADKFLELYQENREIVKWLDKDGRPVRQVACKECRVAILFMGQYYLDDQPNYESPTCKIYNALDYGGPDENLTQPREVAMKFFEEEEHFENELRSRRNEDGDARFSSDFVTPDLAAYRADENEKFAQACKNWNPAKKTLPGQCIVMPQAKRSLLESVNAENLSADHKDLPRRGILSNLCKIFSHIHEQGYVHGDIKPHNVVRHMDDGNITWKAIDFDACTKIGETIGLKLTTGSAPPEMFKIVVNGEEDETGGKSRVILRQPGVDDLDESELVKADQSFDVWSFGILMYQLVTGRTFFHCNNQGDLDDDGLQALANLTQADLTDKIDRVKDINARVLLSNILHLDPKKRPTMAEIGQDYYFNPSASPQGRQAEFFQKKGFDANKSKEKPLPSTPSLDETNEATVEAKDEHDSDHGNGVKDLERFQSSRSEFSYFTMRDEDKDWSDQLLKSEVKEFSFDKLEEIGEKPPKFIDGDSIYKNPFLRDLLSTRGPDYFMGFLVEYFELYKIMSHAHQVCQENKVNLVSDVKSLKGIFIKLFVRGKGLNDIVRGTLFCNSVDLFKYVGTQLKQKYGHNVYIKPPKPGAWPIPKLLIYSKNRIDGRCMSVEIQFSTVYMHLALHASNSHVVYEAMREATDYLDDKDEEFLGFLKTLNEQYIDTEGFLPKEGAQEDEGRFEILVGKVHKENMSDETHTDGQESSEQYTTEATGLILSGRVRCGDYKFEFLRSEDGHQKFSESSFVVNKSLTLLSSHSYWSEESYDLEGKSVEFEVSFQGRGLAIAGIGTSKCFHGSMESDGGGERCSVHVGRSKFVVRKNGTQEVFQEKKLPNQERAKIIFKMQDGVLVVSFVGSSEETTETQVIMPSDQRYYLYMRAPPGVHDVKFHDIKMNWSDMSNDEKPVAKMETAVEREAIEEPMQGTVTVQNQSSSVNDVVEEISISESNILQELPNLQEDDKLHGKLGEMERKLDKMDDMDRKLDELMALQKQGDNPISSKVEKKVPIFEGWLSKRSREHSYLWRDRYFEVYADGDVIYYPKGVYPGDERFGVKLYQNVRWSKINGGEGKLELRSPKKSVVGMVRQSKRDSDSTVDEWFVKGNSWIESPSTSGAGKETKSPSKPRPKGAQTTATGDVTTLYA